VARALPLLIAIVFSRTITGPIDALIRRTEEIGRGGRAAIVAPERQGTREIATLSQSFLDLAGRLVDRTDYVSSFAAHVSHELRSPITSIRGAAELLRDAEMSAAERARFLDHIIADADRLTALLDSLRELARAELSGEAATTTLREVLGDAAPAEHADVRLAIGATAARAVFEQLRRNARENGATQIRIETARGAEMRIVVRDDGPGISPGHRDRVFEPFFTTRRESGGTGMGLAIVRAMLGAHGGGIEVLETEAGAAFELRVPLG
jgi:signal transduction histidine kinase